MINNVHLRILTHDQQRRNTCKRNGKKKVLGLCISTRLYEHIVNELVREVMEILAFKDKMREKAFGLAWTTHEKGK